jgi:RNA polymerase II subunit A small phosphatase-like protein
VRSSHECIHNDGNAIYVKEYEGQPDDELLHLGRYLSTLMNTANVRTLEKRGGWTRQSG